MEPIEVSLYFERSKSKTMNLNHLAELLRAWGWKDGKAYAIPDLENKTLTLTNSLVESAPILMMMKEKKRDKGNAPTAIWSPVLRCSYKIPGRVRGDVYGMSEMQGAHEMGGRGREGVLLPVRKARECAIGVEGGF